MIIQSSKNEEAASCLWYYANVNVLPISANYLFNVIWGFQAQYGFSWRRF